MTVNRSTRLKEPVTLDDLLYLNSGEIDSMPTLSSGHTDDLKFDNGHFRLWQSRMTRRDCESDEQWQNQRFTVEELIDGRWTLVGSVYGSPKRL